MKMLIVFALGMNYWSCAGFPVYDYDQSSLTEALSASVAKVNSRSLSPYLFRAFRSSMKRVSAHQRKRMKTFAFVEDLSSCCVGGCEGGSPDSDSGRNMSSIVNFRNTSLANRCFVFMKVNVLDEDSLSMDIEFSIRETTCRRDSGEDPATCDFQRGYYVPAAICRSTVRVAAQEVQDVWVRCRWSSSSESSSSEEV
ncbi:hypothetical protein HPG69_010739 [Diceros bicornis minor]|uniref:Secreted phosphoprotein 24 n=1 Tax=Diceros bicornis minor TaxID=77932 RepID=A0A7J7EU93_DICBM|nr:hypothetical protein HPG69_010739 [Diceros bicornis minor]